MSMNHEEIYFSAEEFFKNVFSNMEQSNSSIQVNTYILENDTIGKSLIQHLKKAAARGVHCRLLVDGFGTRHWVRKIEKTTERKNFDIRVFNPISIYWFLNIKAWSRYGVHYLSRLNRRDHKKLVIIDDKIVYTGSVNFSAKTLEQTELAIVSDYPISQCLLYFKYTWDRSRPLRGYALLPFKNKFAACKLRPDKYIRCNYNFITRWENNSQLYEAIDKAQTRIWFVTPYFMPSVRLLKHLWVAVANNKDVSFLFPETSNIFFMKWVARYYYPVVLKKGARIYEYPRNFLHAKVTIVDDQIFVGSSNLDHRSIFTNLELDLFVQKHENKKKIVKWVSKIMAESNPIHEKDIHLNFFQRIVLSVATFLEKILSR